MVVKTPAQRLRSVHLVLGLVLLGACFISSSTVSRPAAAQDLYCGTAGCGYTHYGAEVGGVSGNYLTFSWTNSNICGKFAQLSSFPDQAIWNYSAGAGFPCSSLNATVSVTITYTYQGGSFVVSCYDPNGASDANLTIAGPNGTTTCTYPNGEAPPSRYALFTVGDFYAQQFLTQTGSGPPESASSTSSIANSTTQSPSPGPGPSQTIASCKPNPLALNATSICTAQVTGDDPTGAVVWSQTSSDGGLVTFLAPTNSTCALAGGVCDVKVNGTVVGSVTVQAQYEGDANNLPSAGSTLLLVNSGITSTGLSSLELGLVAVAVIAIMGVVAAVLLMRKKEAPQTP